MSKKILFWVGYSKSPWNGHNSYGLAGSEIATLNVAEGLANYGHEVVVAGEVQTGQCNGVTWLDIPTFLRVYSSKPDWFNEVIGVNYIHFIKYAELANQNKARKTFWLHNTEYHEWFEGSILENHKDLLDQIDCMVTPSGWSRDYIKDNMLPPYYSGMNIAIPNGIHSENFKAEVAKKPNSFIWSSAIDRGLVNLLNQWPKIKGNLQGATLDVYWPKYSEGFAEMSWIKENQSKLEALGVTFHGTVSQADLHIAMQKAEYWMYLTGYEETFCITALEMAAAGVLCITTNVAALTETVESGIIIQYSDDETMFNQAIELLMMSNKELLGKATKDNKEKAKMSTWNEVSSKWHDYLV